ncbi:unnamed protein product, partial [Ixodes persulcatus]
VQCRQLVVEFVVDHFVHFWHPLGSLKHFLRRTYLAKLVVVLLLGRVAQTFHAVPCFVVVHKLAAPLGYPALQCGQEKAVERRHHLVVHLAVIVVPQQLQRSRERKWIACLCLDGDLLVADPLLLVDLAQGVHEGLAG